MVGVSSLLLSVLAAWTTVAYGEKVLCPILGPVFPYPTNVQSQPSFIVAISTLTKSLAVLASEFPEISFSISITTSEKAVWSHHHTGNSLDPGSTKKVDGDTAYRIASITKVFTALTALLEVGWSGFEEPITTYVPELRGLRGKAGIDWETVTLKQLGSHLSGLHRDYASFDLSDPTFGFSGELLGLPPVNNTYAPCGKNAKDKPCTRKQFFDGIRKLGPVFLPEDRPSYSNLAFEVMGYAIESITKKTFEKALHDRILGPLGMAKTSIKTPADGRGVIPNVTNDWYFQLGHTNPAGGLYSTTNDLSRFLRAILASNRYPATKFLGLNSVAVREWLKPVSFTAGMRNAQGMPWEIYRFDGDSQLTPDERVIDAYTKGGGLTAYVTNIILIPELDLGITVLTAGNLPILSDIIEETLRAVIPSVDEITREQAQATYAGTYSLNDPKNGGNTTLVLAVDDGPGLHIKTFISRGVDLIEILKMVGWGTIPGNITVRLYPTGVEGSSRREYWRMAWGFKVDGSFNGTTATGGLRRRMIMREVPGELHGFTLRRKTAGILGGMGAPVNAGEMAFGGGSGGAGGTAILARQDTCFGDSDLLQWGGKAVSEFVFRSEQKGGKKAVKL